MEKRLCVECEKIKNGEEFVRSIYDFLRYFCNSCILKVILEKDYKEDALDYYYRKHMSMMQKRRKLKDVKHVLNNRISGMIWKALRKNKNGYRWEKLVGYTVNDLKTHLEKRFKQGMDWQNIKDWHIDHIIPKSLFKFNSYNDREFKQCWALANLQPLWAEENLMKKDKCERTL